MNGYNGKVWPLETADNVLEELVYTLQFFFVYIVTEIIFINVGDPKMLILIFDIQFILGTL